MRPLCQHTSTPEFRLRFQARGACYNRCQECQIRFSFPFTPQRDPHFLNHLGVCQPTDTRALAQTYTQASEPTSIASPHALLHYAQLLDHRSVKQSSSPSTHESKDPNGDQSELDRRSSSFATHNGKYGYHRVQCEDPEIIRGWFEYSIQEAGIYNFDKTGFQMGVIWAAIVVTISEQCGRASQSSPAIGVGNSDPGHQCYWLDHTRSVT
jgi:hypothetical protein